MRLALISDIHEDIVSLEKALNIIGNKNVDEIACLGDIVGFSELHYPYAGSRNANECVRLVKENCKYSVLGNHDLFHLKKTSEFNKVFSYPNNWYEISKEERILLCSDIIWSYEDENQTILNDISINYLSNLPEFQLTEKGVFLSHYLYPDIAGDTTIFRKWPEQCKEHFEFVHENGGILSVSGHMHIQGLLLFNNNSRRYKNFGTFLLKQKLKHIFVPPISSGSPKNGFCIVDTDNKKIEGIRIP